MKQRFFLLSISVLLAGSAAGQSMSLKFDGPVPPADTVRRDVTRYPQGSTYVPLDVDVYRLIDRYALRYGSELHTSVRPYSRAMVARLAERILQDSANLTPQDRFNARYLLRDNWANTPRDDAFNRREQPIFKHFYKRPSDLYSVDIPDFTLRVNPVAGLSLGNSDGTKSYTFLNTRGAQVEGTIDERLGFYTFLADNQMAVPLYVQQRVQRDSAVAHEGFWKPFKNQPGQYDFLTARGYLTYAASRHISIQLGHDRNQIGNGYRSLILSDFSSPYLFLKLQTRIWRFSYQNLFAQLVADAPYRDASYDRKYLAFHHLSFDVTPNFNVGVFESVLYSGYSDTNDTLLVTTRGGQQSRVIRPRRRGFELQYLNPIIFYRAVEQSIGSPDNALLGLDFKWNIRQRVQLYGQLVLDELVVSQVRSRRGWWANKQAVQLGGRYINVAGIRNLDVQGEFNFVRPYTYQHEDKYRNYQHHAQPLAHPLGANFWELVGIVSYQPLPRLQVVAKGFLSEQGLDNNPFIDPEPNYGGNVLKPYTTRVQDFNNRVGQGNRTRLLHLDFTATWQAAHNLWLDGKLVARRQTSEFVPIIPNTSPVLATAGLRWNIAQRLHEF